MKKKYLIGIVLIICIISILAILYRGSQKGNIENVEIVIGESEIFTEQEIQDAINLVLEKFENNYPATLIKIWYDEETAKKEYEIWKHEPYSGDTIILYVSFETYDKVSSNTGLEANYTYSYGWYMFRDTGGNWYFKN